MCYNNFVLFWVYLNILFLMLNEARSGKDKRINLAYTNVLLDVRNICRKKHDMVVLDLTLALIIPNDCYGCQQWKARVRAFSKGRLKEAERWPFSLLGTGQATSGALLLVLGCPVQERYWFIWANQCRTKRWFRIWSILCMGRGWESWELSAERREGLEALSNVSKVPVGGS